MVNMSCTKEQWVKSQYSAIQLGHKELELTAALQKQKLYQDGIQDINKKLDQSQKRLGQIDSLDLGTDADSLLRDIQVS